MLKYIAKLLPVKTPVRAHINERENYLKTVLDSMEIESGANSNGSWTKFPDGTLICIHRMMIPSQYAKPWGALNYINGDRWTFPIPFVEFPSISGSNRDVNGFFASDATKEAFLNEPRWVCVSSGQFQVSSLRLVAIGRWKN